MRSDQQIVRSYRAARSLQLCRDGAIANPKIYRGANESRLNPPSIIRTNDRLTPPHPPKCRCSRATASSSTSSRLQNAKRA